MAKSEHSLRGLVPADSASRVRTCATDDKPPPIIMWITIYSRSRVPLTAN